MKIQSTEQWGGGLIDVHTKIVTDQGEYTPHPSYGPKYDGIVERLAPKYVGKKVPWVLCERLQKLINHRIDPIPFLPMRVVRPPRGETSKTGFLDTHWVSVPLDLAVFENRWEVSLREEKEYQSGHYLHSRIFYTSILKVKDRETGRIKVIQEKLTPDGNGPNEFGRHLGDRVLAMRVVGDNQIVVKTRFGCQTKILEVDFCSTDS